MGGELFLLWDFQLAYTDMQDESHSYLLPQTRSCAETHARHEEADFKGNTDGEDKC